MAFVEWSWRWCAWRVCSPEGLNNDHRCTARGTHVRVARSVVGIEHLGGRFGLISLLKEEGTDLLHSGWRVGGWRRDRSAGCGGSPLGGHG